MADIDPLVVKFSSDTSGLTEGTETASKAVQDAFNRMSASLSNMGEKLKTGADTGSASMTGMASTVSTAMTGMGAAISAALLPIMAIIAAYKALGAVINATVDEAEEVKGLMNSFGMASDKASELNVTLKLLGIGSEEYTGMAMKMDRQVRSNEDGLKKLGMTTRDGNGHLLSQQDLLRSGVATMMTYAAGTDRNAAAMAIFGRSAQDAYKLNQLTNESMARGAEVAARLGDVMSGEALDGVRAYQLKMNELGVVFDSFMEKMGAVVIPVLVKFAEKIIEIATVLMPAFNVSIQIAGGLFSAFANIVTMAVDVLIGSFSVLVAAAKTMALALYHALSFDGKVIESFQAGWQEMQNIAHKSMNKIVADAKNMWKDVVADVTGGGGGTGTARMPAGGNKLYNHQDKKDVKDKQEKSQMPQFEEELLQAKLLYEGEHNLREMGKVDELAFWQNIKATHKLSQQDLLSIDKTIAMDKLEINKKALKDREGLAKEEVEFNEKFALEKIKIEEEASKTMVESGKRTKLEDLTAQIGFENQRYEIIAAAQAARVTLAELDPDNPVEKQKQLDKVLEIYQTHALALQKLQTNVVKETVASNERMLAPITNAISASVQGMIQGTLTLENAMKHLLQSIIASFIDTMAKMATHWVAEQMGEVSVAKTYAAIKTGLMASSAATTTAVKATEATAVVSANAAEGASGAAASVASIPFVGWTMVAGVFAATMALIKGAMGGVSAAGGYDIPAGTNPVAQLHAKEMVLPASQADVIRNMASGGGGGGSPVNFHVSAMDADSVKKFFAKNKGSLVQALNQASRNGMQLNHSMRTS